MAGGRHASAEAEAFARAACYSGTMTRGPDISRIAALIGDPARAAMLDALMSGRALTAAELAGAAGVTPQTASGHLAKLTDGGLLRRRVQGRHRYFALASSEVAALLEQMGRIGLSAGPPGAAPRTGPRDAALREARVCYNHLAGRRGVQLYDGLVSRGWLEERDARPELTGAGEAGLGALGIDVAGLRRGRAPLCRDCLDWSERRTHLAGSVGRALFSLMEGQGWARRVPEGRAVRFTPEGERRFREAFG